MPRTAAWILLIAATAFAYTLAFTPFEHTTDRYRSNDEGGFVRVKIECPSPVSVLFFDGDTDSGRDAGSCELPARGHLIESVLVFGVGLLFAWKPIIRARPTSIGPISDKLDI